MPSGTWSPRTWKPAASPWTRAPTRAATPAWRSPPLPPGWPPLPSGSRGTWLRSREQASPGIEHLVALSDVVKVSDEDLRWLYPGEGDEDVARRWLSMGPGLVVVTRAGEGVYTVSRNLEVRRPAVPVDLVDTVGAH